MEGILIPWANQGQIVATEAASVYSNHFQMENSSMNTNYSDFSKTLGDSDDTLQLRFWPGNGNAAQTSQGLVALIVMVTLFCLVVIYCCWGACCRFLHKRIPVRNGDDSGTTCTYPTVMVLPYAGMLYIDQQANSSNCLGQQVKNNNQIELPPPSYELLFGEEGSIPPAYSSLQLDQNSSQVFRGTNEEITSSRIVEQMRESDVLLKNDATLHDHLPHVESSTSTYLPLERNRTITAEA